MNDWSWLADAAVNALTFLAWHRFVMMPVLIVAALIAAALARRRWRWFVGALGILLAVGNLTVGPLIVAVLIDHAGVDGRGTVTSSYDTGVETNDQRVQGFNVLIRTADGTVVETEFDEDDFNVYPPHNETSYPGVGSEFNVRYLRRYPGSFVILSEDQSPWATGTRCTELERLRGEAEAKARFAPEVERYRDALAAATEAEKKAECR